MDLAKLKHHAWSGVVMPIALAIGSTFTPGTVRDVLLIVAVMVVAWAFHNTEFGGKRWRRTAVVLGIASALAVGVFFVGQRIDAQQKPKQTATAPMPDTSVHPTVSTIEAPVAPVNATPPTISATKDLQLSLDADDFSRYLERTASDLEESQRQISIEQNAERRAALQGSLDSNTNRVLKEAKKLQNRFLAVGIKDSGVDLFVSDPRSTNLPQAIRKLSGSIRMLRATLIQRAHIPPIAINLSGVKNSVEENQINGGTIRVQGLGNAVKKNQVRPVADDAPMIGTVINQDNRNSSGTNIGQHVGPLTVNQAPEPIVTASAQEISSNEDIPVVDARTPWKTTLTISTTAAVSPMKLRLKCTGPVAGGMVGGSGAFVAVNKLQPDPTDDTVLIVELSQPEVLNPGGWLSIAIRSQSQVKVLSGTIGKYTIVFQ